MTSKNPSEDKNSKSKEYLIIEHLWQNTLSELSRFYLNANPEKSEDAFINEFYKPILEDNFASGDGALEQIKAIKEADATANLKYGPMLTTCAYLVQAIKALKSDEIVLAWSCMAEARFYCGVVSASKGIEDARIKTIKATRIGTAKKAGKALDELKYGDIRKKVFELAREVCKNSKEKLSRMEVARTIEPEVFNFSIGKKGELSKDQAFDTIYGWLAKMPDAASIFKKKQGANKKKTPE